MEDDLTPCLPNGQLRPGYWLEREARDEILDRYGDHPRGSETRSVSPVTLPWAVPHLAA